MSTEHKLKKYFGHPCTLDIKDFLSENIPEAGLIPTIRRVFWKISHISDSSPRTKRYCRSQKKLNSEKIYHLKKHPCMFHPLSCFRKWWEVFMIIITTTYLTYLPFISAYSLLPLIECFPDWTYKIRYCFDALFFIDLVLNFFTGYYDEKGKIILEPRLVAKHYMLTVFVPDFLASMPPTHDPTIRLQKLSYISLFLNFLILCLKCLKIFAVIRYIQHIGEELRFNTFQVKLMQVLSSLFVMVHWFSCYAILYGSYNIGLFEESQPNPIYNTTWLTNNDLWNTSKEMIYVTSFYRQLCFLSTGEYHTGFWDNNYDMFMKCILWLTSKFIYTLLVCFFIQVSKSLSSSKSKYRKKISLFVDYMKQKNLKRETKDRLLSFYEFKYQHCLFKENEIQNNISNKLKVEMMMMKCQKLIENVDFFKGLPLGMLINIATRLEQEFYLTNDVIIGKDSKGDCMYLILSGTVAVFTRAGMEITRLYDGEYFGEIEMIMPKYTHLTTVIAVEPCEIYRLQRDDFNNALGSFPEILQNIMYNATARLQNIVMIDERHKQFMAERSNAEDDYFKDYKRD